MFVDAHAHLDKYTDDEIRDVIATIEQEQILTLSVSVDTESFVRAESIAQLARFVVPAFGVQPSDAPRFADALDVLDEMISAHFYFSIGVEVLHSDHIRRIAARIPDEQLLTETDNPGGQHWVTGTWGYPEVLRDIVCEIAAVRGVAITDIETLVAHNFTRITDQDVS